MGKVTGKSTVVEGSVGFQFGGEAFSEIIFLWDRVEIRKELSRSVKQGDPR